MYCRDELSVRLVEKVHTKTSTSLEGLPVLICRTNFDV